MREVPSWNLNCISDKPTLTSQEYTETLLHIIRDNRSIQYYTSSLETNFAYVTRNVCIQSHIAVS